MGGTQPPPQPTPTPTPGTGTTQPTPTPTRAIGPPDPTPTYNLGTATENDSKTVSQTHWVRHVYDEYLKPAGSVGATEGVKIFATGVRSMLFGPSPTKKALRDRAVPTQGVDGTTVYAPRDALHIPINWIDGIRGNAWGNEKHYANFITRPDTKPQNSLFTGKSFVTDSFTYVSPFTGVSYVDSQALLDSNGSQNVRTTWGGIIPYFAWGVRENQVRFTGSGGSIKYKFAKTYFFKEVFDDWMAFHGYAPYDINLDGIPAMGWPGVMNCVDPFGIDYTGGGEPFVGIKNWVVKNDFIAHFEYSEDITTERVQKLRPPKFVLTDKNELKQIEYPSGMLSTKDEIPEYHDNPVSTGAIPGNEVREQQGDRPVRSVEMTDERMNQFLDNLPPEEGTETDIPVLPSNPPAEDDEGTFKDWKYIQVFDGIDMNVGDAEYLDEDGDVILSPGGQSFSTTAEAQSAFGPLQAVYGYVFGNGRAYGNNMKPFVMSLDKHYSYNNDYDYYSKMVMAAPGTDKVVGFVYSNYRTNTAPAHAYGDIVTSTTGFELRDQDRLKAFDFGKAVDGDNMHEFTQWLVAQTWNGKNNNDNYYCMAFELDLEDGSGYTNGFM